MGVANIGFGPFGILNNYPKLKQEFACLTWVAALGLIGIPQLARPDLSRRHFKIVIVLTVASLAVGFVLRQDVGIFKARSAIIATPFPATSKIMSAVEDFSFEVFQSLPEIKSGGKITKDDASEREMIRKSQLTLDQLVPGRKDLNVIWIAVDTLRF